MEEKKNSKAWKVGAGAAGAAAVAKAVGGAGLLKSGFLIKTLLGVFISLAVYARIYGIEFAVLVIVLLFIHESGHWLFMKMKGLDPDAPVFVPFVGAYVAMNKMPADEATHAWVAFAGPLVGTMGALVMYAIGSFTNNPALMAGGNFGFYLNLLQLIPVKPLDGGFIASAVSKWLLIPGTILILLLGFLCQSILMIIIGGISVFALFKKKKKPGTVSANPMSPAPAVSGATSTAPAAEHPIEMKRATGKQRLGIGAAYMSLAIFLGAVQIFAALQITYNKSFAAAQIPYLTQQIEQRNDPGDLRERSQCYATIGKIKEAEADLSRAMAANTEDAGDYITQARYRLATGQIDATTYGAIDTAANLTKDQSWDSWQVARQYLLVNEFDKALKVADRCDEGDKNDIRAAVYARTNKSKEARAGYEVAVNKISTYMPGTYCQKALLEISQGELPLAKVDIEEAESRDPDDPLTILTRGWYALQSGDTTTALKRAEEAIKKFDEDNFERSDRCHILSGCHELKAAAYKKLSSASAGAADKSKYDQLATDEIKAASGIAGSGFYSPISSAANRK